MVYAAARGSYARTPFLTLSELYSCDLTFRVKGGRAVVTSLLESRLLWGGLSWLCLLGFALWLLAMLFPVPGSSDETDFNDGWKDEPEEVVAPPETYLKQQEGSWDEDIS